MDRRRISLLFVLLALFSSTAAIGATQTSVIPYAVGNRWEYRISETGVVSVGEGETSRSMTMQQEGTAVDEIVSIQERRDDGIVYLERTVQKMEEGDNTPASESTDSDEIFVTKKGILQLSNTEIDSTEGNKPQYTEYNPPLVVFPADMKKGTKWHIGTVRTGDLRVPTEGMVLGTETVTVPAGTFRDCLKVSAISNKVSGSIGTGDDRMPVKSGKGVETLWIAPGVGVVKMDAMVQAKIEVKPPGQSKPILSTFTHRSIRELEPGYRVRKGE